MRTSSNVYIVGFGLTSLPSALYGEKCSESLVPFGAAMAIRSEGIQAPARRAIEGLHRFCCFRTKYTTSERCNHVIDVSPERGDA